MSPTKTHRFRPRLLRFVGVGSRVSGEIRRHHSIGGTMTETVNAPTAEAEGAESTEATAEAKPVVSLRDRLNKAMQKQMPAQRSEERRVGKESEYGVTE